MATTLRHVALCLAGLLTGAEALYLPAHAQTPNPEQWRHDLVTLVRELEVRHANLYHTVSRETFREATDQLASRIPLLEDHEIIVELTRLVTMVGDGHTLIPLLWDREVDFGKLPLELVEAEDGVLILATATQYSDLLGARVIHIEGTPVDQAMRAVAPLISRDHQRSLRGATAFLVVPEVLHALDLIENLEHVELLVEDEAGERRIVSVQAVPRATEIEWQHFSSADTLPLWLRNREDRYWFSHLPDRRTVFVQFNRADWDKEEESVAEFGDRLYEYIADHDVSRLVLDLRWNSGGSRWRARHLLNAIIRIEHLLGGERVTRWRIPSGGLFTIIGPTTFSAAAQFALDLELHTNTVFVGQPTAGKPNHYGELGRFRLPNSNLEIRYSVFYHQASHPRDTRPAIFPDLQARHSTAHYRDGTDPALEAIWNYQPRAPITEVMWDAIQREGVNAAIRAFRQIKHDNYNEYDFTYAERELNRLGYQLLEADRVDDAIAIFVLNAEEYPWSANVYDSLVDAYLRAGRSESALQNARRAFLIDKQYTRILEMEARDPADH